MLVAISYRLIRNSHALLCTPFHRALKLTTQSSQCCDAATTAPLMNAMISDNRDEVVKYGAPLNGAKSAMHKRRFHI